MNSNECRICGRDIPDEIGDKCFEHRKINTVKMFDSETKVFLGFDNEDGD